MAVKVVYDATRGLVQENDPTGAGGFDIKDTFLDQGTETVAAPGNPISPRGTSVVTTTANNDAVTLADGTAVGQIKIVVYKEATSGTAGDNLVITVASGNNVTLSDEGDVAMLVWSGTSWLVIGQS